MTTSVGLGLASGSFDSDLRAMVPRLIAGSSASPTCRAGLARQQHGRRRHRRRRCGTCMRRRRAWGACPASGTAPLAMLSLRPGATSTVPRPRLTVAVRPVMRTVRSASRIAGSSRIGCSVVPLVSMSTDSPSSGVGGPLCLKSRQRRVARDHDALDGAAGDMLLDPARVRARRDESRPQPLHHRDRHTGGGDAEGEMRIGQPNNRGCRSPRRRHCSVGRVSMRPMSP